MMVSANCYYKTLGKCRKSEKDSHSIGFYKDRYRKEFPVSIFCDYCYNIIWNCVPLSLHNYRKPYEGKSVRIAFTTETKEQSRKILEYFLSKEDALPVPFEEFTAGHEKRGVE